MPLLYVVLYLGVSARTVVQTNSTSSENAKIEEAEVFIEKSSRTKHEHVASAPKQIRYYSICLDTSQTMFVILHKCHCCKPFKKSSVTFLAHLSIIKIAYCHSAVMVLEVFKSQSIVDFA